MREPSAQTKEYYAVWVERFARFGYAAKCFVYVLVGLLAAQAAFTASNPEGSEDALAAVAKQPFGKIVLALVAIGLFGYVLWRFVQAIQDPEHEQSGAKNILRRIAYGMSGFIYTGLMLSVLRSIAGTEKNSEGSSTQSWTATLLSQPFGRWLVGTVGAITIGVGCYYFYRAFRAKFRQKLKLHQMSASTEKWVTLVSRIGITARGFVFLLVGGFLIQAARAYDASKAESSEGALKSLENQPFGPWLLAILALGLIAYGVHMGVLARYRQIEVR
ncbi:DUF1206 domain-containing protein [Oscillatoriales cyanobacterium LEGE 11467]|uniref:DUF1206 domain-containing protein n=1 Tax=Zarconia navalis LEGE 11467 TaxID=1828826 RepID=A0A928VTH8_9CYAN|nr:DUF1206 domain-containing protein [Zarconia navalis]MBE9040069.1 DUF1206 domain-containing protein [Zarconia navalis LEGE 11467]